MQWTDTALLLNARPHGERSLILTVLTQRHGVYGGYCRPDKRLRPVLQTGQPLEITWRARLEEHLGMVTAEALPSSLPALMQDGAALMALQAACAVVAVTVPERAPCPAIYTALDALIHALDTDDWPLLFVRWEVQLLAELGYGLDLDHCAVTGGTADLVYVSPRTGRAVSRNAAGEWADRLLPLPPCLVGQAHWTDSGIARGLHLTSHFLKKYLRDHARASLPESRVRLERSFSCDTAK